MVKHKVLSNTYLNIVTEREKAARKRKMMAGWERGKIRPIHTNATTMALMISMPTRVLRNHASQFTPRFIPIIFIA